MNQDTEKTFALPYKLIDIDTGREHFVLSFKSFARHQDGFSIKHSGLNGDFEAAYRCSGIDSRFECDMTTGELFAFYHELDNVYNCLPGTESAATLKNNDDTLSHTRMTFRAARLKALHINYLYFCTDQMQN